MSTLELIWQHDAPYAVVRSDDGVLTDDGLAVGSRTEIHVAGSHAVARRLSVRRSDRPRPDPAARRDRPRGARAARPRAAHGRRRARASAADAGRHDLVRVLGRDARRGPAGRARRDRRRRAARPPASSTSSTRSSSTRSPATACSPPACARRASSSSAARRRSKGCCARSPRPSPTCRPARRYATLERRLSRWVDVGLAGDPRDALAARPAPRRAPRPRRARARAVAARRRRPDAQPAGLAALSAGRRRLRVRARRRPGRRPRGAARASWRRSSSDGSSSTSSARSTLDTEATCVFLRELMPELERARRAGAAADRVGARAGAHPRERDARASARRRAACSRPRRSRAFDWRLAVGDVDLSEEELRRARRGEEPGRAGRAAAGRRCARRTCSARCASSSGASAAAASSTSCAPSPGSRPTRRGSSSATVTLDRSLAELLDGEARFKPLGDAARRCSSTCSRSRSAATAGCACSATAGSARSSPTTWGSGRRCRRSRCSLSERENGATLGPTLVVCPMSVARQWVAEVERFAPSLRVHLHHGSDRLADEAAARRRSATSTSSSRRTTSPRATSTRSPRSRWDRLLLDEAQDVKNPADEARALAAADLGAAARSR